MPEMQVQYLGWEISLEKEMATHSSILAWEIHVQRSLADYSPEGCKVRHNLKTQQQQHFMLVMFSDNWVGIA